MTAVSPSILFCFDYISPYSYLAATQMPALAARLGIPVIWQPVNLPYLIRLSGNHPPATIPNKAKYLLRDLKQRAQLLDVPFRMIMPGAFDSRPALAATQALAGEDRQRMALAVFRALWAEGLDYRRDDWLQLALAAGQLPADWSRPESYSQQMENVDHQTANICNGGAFGAPTFFVQGMGRRQMFWGVDRLDFLEHAMAQKVHER